MKDGHCPMCHSTEVYANSNERFFASNTRVHLSNADGETDIATAFVPYVCLNCGFTAMYAQDMNALKDILKTKGWTKVAK